MKRVCVYCGSNSGFSREYREAARGVGHYLGQHQIALVYGGGKVGLMGAMADAALEAGGEVYGVIPKSLAERELAHHGITELRVVETMHERKQTMANLSDGFIALPGGLGTMEELFEIFTWAQIGIHEKPFGILDVNSYYEDLFRFLARMVKDGFLKQAHHDALFCDQEIGPLIVRMRNHSPVSLNKWIQEKPLP
jgi:uncharacterized protein (TIGR00730 family)